ncbi:MAG TPA: hypothetical protein PKA63_05165 [Oligoflexia bacterium]|nr:hypothetical protein [Oligoflexia bacterium]HMP48037.1 hypothetical protein [Oligoflexia bacterium]
MKVPAFSLAKSIFLGKSDQIETVGLFRSEGSRGGIYIVRSDEVRGKKKRLKAHHPGDKPSDHYTAIVSAAGDPRWDIRVSEKSLWQRRKLSSFLAIEQGRISINEANDEIQLLLGKGLLVVISVSNHGSDEEANDIIDAYLAVHSDCAVIRQNLDDAVRLTVLGLGKAPYLIPDIPELPNSIWSSIPVEKEESEIDSVLN